MNDESGSFGGRVFLKTKKMICIIIFGIACMGFLGDLLFAIIDENMKKRDEYWEYLNDGYYPFISFERWKEKKREKKNRTK